MKVSYDNCKNIVIFYCIVKIVLFSFAPPITDINVSYMMPEKCYFCGLKEEEKVIDGKLAFVCADNFPVTKYHSLIVPKRHYANFFDITNEELLEINYLLKLRKEQILTEDKKVEGFNIGINIGLAAGQSVFHLHIHLIPRRFGDIENPKGGVRGIIPNKRDY